MKIEKEVKKIEKSIITLSTKVIEQHQNCVVLLKDFSEDDAKRLIQEDTEINTLENEINAHAMEDIVLLHPVASDLRQVIAAIKIASELERIGDYAKGLAKFLIKTKDEASMKKYLDDAIYLEVELVAMMKMIIKSYQQHDSEVIFRVREFDKKIENMIHQFKNKIVSEQEEAQLVVFYLSSLLRNISRTKDHCINICEHIVYLDKGILYDFELD